MFSVAELLTPLFNTGSVDVELARRMAVSAIDAYQPETRADFINVGRTIAFSMAALALLGSAASADMTMSQKLRTLGRANALNRSADQSERTMMQRRRYQQASPSAEPPDLAAEYLAADRESDDAELQVAIVEALREHRTHRVTATTAATSEAAAAAPTPATPRPPQAVPIHPPVTPSVTAMRYGGPRSDHGQPTTVRYKETLLRHSAMQRVAGQGGSQQSV
jgi:hypothetical protein